MNVTDQWHYTTRNGAQAGPVTKTELMQLISSNIVPENAVVWKDGMATWTPLAQVAELQPQSEAQEMPSMIAPATAPAAATSPKEVNPYTPPSAIEPSHPNITGASFENTMEYGGVRRLNYFLKTILYSLLAIILIVVGASMESLILAAIAGIALLVVLIWLSYQRIKNIGASGWWLLLMLVPIASSILQIGLLACPEGYADHKKLDTAGIVIGSILIVLNILSIGLNVAGVLSA